MTDLDEDRLEQLVGVHSSKTGYYAQWRGAERRAAELTRRNEQLRRAREHLARVRQAELVSAERHRIARDLHDSVAQCLVGIGMHLEWCHRHLDPSSPAYERLVASKELARAGLGWVRSAVEELSGLEQPGTGLGQALRDLAADFRSAGQLRVSVRVTARQRQLPSAVEHALFQIAQEGLWNAVRHAHATQAWLSLAYAEDQILLSVADDGSRRSRRARPLPHRCCLKPRHLRSGDLGPGELAARQARAAEHRRARGRTRRRGQPAAQARRRPADQRPRPGGSRGRTSPRDSYMKHGARKQEGP